MLELFLLAILLRIMQNLERNPHSRRRDQQAECKTVAGLADHLFLVISSPLARSALTVARAVRVLSFHSGLTDQRHIRDKDVPSRFPWRFLPVTGENPMIRFMGQDSFFGKTSFEHRRQMAQLQN